MKTPKPKGPGRPPGNPERKSVKPNITLRKDLIAEAEEAASKKGMGFSEYVTMSLTKQIGRDQAAEEEVAASKVSTMLSAMGAAKKGRKSSLAK